MTGDTCRSEVGLELLAQGMAKQYDCYQDALQEFIDNSVASRVESEKYFENPYKSIEIEVSIHRHENVVHTIVADNGPGISREDLENDVFRTGNKSVSHGILNNVGWGLKASLSWFEHTLGDPAELPAGHVFSLLSKSPDGSFLGVDGPITGELPIRDAHEEEWAKGLMADSGVPQATTGTKIRVSCSREQFDNDLWPSGDQMGIKVQALRERLGLLFRRLLDANEDNRIHVSFKDHVVDERDSYEVLPLNPVFVDGEDEHEKFEFAIDAEDAVYNIEYEKGTLDFEAMRERYEDDHPELFTSGGNFRTRFRPSQTNQGVDVYANGRVLMTSVFSDLYDRTRNNEFNYFGGVLRIFPDCPEAEVPTDNKKTRIDTTSDLWKQLSEKLSKDPYSPIGKNYHDDGSSPSSSSESKEDSQEDESEDHSPSPIASNISNDDSLFGMHHGDTRELLAHLNNLKDGGTSEGGLVDVTITSPPYGDIKDYGYDPDRQIGFGSSYNDYLEDLREIFSEVYDVTKPDGTLWLVVNTFNQDGQMYNLPADITRVLQNLQGELTCPECSSANMDVPLAQPQNSHPPHCVNCGYSGGDNSWTLQDVVIWDKKRALPYSGQGKLRNVFEYVLFFSKSEEYTFDLDDIRICDPAQFKDWWVDYPERYHPRGKVPENIWDVITPSQGAFGFQSLDHPAPFPPKLVERMLQLTSRESDVVLDPFAGSGMVVAQAEEMDRRPIGFELNQEYCDNFSSVKAELREYLEKKGIGGAADGRDHLAEIIGGLRQTKLIQRLFMQLAEAQNAGSATELDIEAVFHNCGHIDRTVADSENFINMDLTLLVDEGSPASRVQQLEDLANNSLSSPPLTAYGVIPSVSVRKAGTPEASPFNKEMDAKQPLFLYTDYHYKYDRKVTHPNWRQILTSGSETVETGHRFPPILSNIGLRVQNPRRDDYEVDDSGTVTHSITWASKLENPESASIVETQPSPAD